MVMRAQPIQRVGESETLREEGRLFTLMWLNDSESTTAYTEGKGESEGGREKDFYGDVVECILPIVAIVTLKVFLVCALITISF